MSLINRAIADARRYTTDGSDWGNLVTFEAPNGQKVTIVARTNKIRVSLDGEGRPYNSKNASVSFSEGALVDAGYAAIRDASSKEVKMRDHKVSWKDSTGDTFKYRISETYPDETLGLIVGILTDYSTE